jgi:surfactin synthase thioesterase subunit
VHDERRWLLSFRPATRPRARLVCFPWAGGAPSAFSRWHHGLPPDVEVHAVVLPGRPPRFAEPPLSRMEPIVDALARALPPLLDVPAVFFGHSMGATLAFEVTRVLERAQLAPAHLVVSGAPAPQLARDGEQLHLLDDERLLSRLAELGGLPSAVRAERELLSLLLPAIRADLEALETWRYLPGPPLRVPLTAFGGDDDALARGRLDGWRAQTTRSFALRMFAGDHFFLLGQERAILDEITRIASGLRPLPDDVRGA